MRRFICASSAVVSTVAAAFGAVTVRPDGGSVGAPLAEAGVTEGGAWSVPAEASASIVAAEVGKGVALANAGNERVSLAFDEAFADRPTQFDMRTSFPEVSWSVEAPRGAEAKTRFAITLAERAHGGITFAGYSKSGWTFLTGEGVVAEPGRWYDIRIETRDVGGAAYASCLVKVGEDYVRLANEVGAAWFRLAGEGSSLRALGFSGDGRFADITGDRGTAEPQPVTVRWAGGASGDWEDGSNWSRTADGGAPAAGDVVEVGGTVKMMRGDETATIRDGVFAVGADGTLTALAGSLATPLALDRTQVRIGRPLRVGAASFGGLTPTVTSCRWWRGDLSRHFAADAVASGPDYAPTADDCEKWLRVIASGAGGETFSDTLFVSRLPVLYLTTDDGATPSQNKEEHGGRVFVQGNGTDAKSFAGDSALTIKVRGNSTSTLPKKPWKIKLAKKQKMFGIPKSKHWVLLANYNDESSMRNKLAYDFANEIGNLGMRSTWVECVLNGQWQGLYQFCEHIRIDKDRVNVFNWEDEAEERGESDTDFGWVDPAKDDITGGYLFESSTEYDEISRFTVYSGNLVLQTMVNSPEHLKTNQGMMDWCKTFLQDYADAITSVDGYSKGLHYSDYCDLDSMATYFLVMEMFGNYDAAKKSRYFYKDRGGLLKFGPVWDFDWGVGNAVAMKQSTAISAKQDVWPEIWWTAAHKESFYREWADDPWFCTRLRTLYWGRARDVFARLIASGGEMDQYKSMLAEAGAANDGKWKRSVGFSAEVENLRTYLTARLAWLDKQFADVQTLMDSFRAETTSKRAWTESTPSTCPYDRATATLPITVIDAEGDKFTYCGQSPRLAFTVGGTAVRSVGVYVNGLKVGEPLVLGADRRVSVKLPMSMFTAGKGEENCLSVVGFDAGGKSVARNYFLVTVDRVGGFILYIR